MHTYLSLLLSKSNNNSLVQFKELQDEKIGRLQEEVEICFTEMRWWGGDGVRGGRGRTVSIPELFSLLRVHTYMYIVRYFLCPPCPIVGEFLHMGSQCESP